MIELRGVELRLRRASRPCSPASTSPSTRASSCWSPGPTGVGKSTLLGVVTGLVPRFTGGRLTGDVLLDGTSIVRTPPRERAHVDRLRRPGPRRRLRHRHRRGGARLRHGAARPAAGHDAPAGRGDPRPAGHRRPARPRPAHPLGGQQQRVAIGSVLTMHPRLLVLDEPTSALDPTAAEDVLATLTRLVHDLGVSVLLAEHRLERVVPVRRPDVPARAATAALRGRATRPSCCADSPVVPPIVELGRAGGLEPLPLTVREARRRPRAGLDLVAPPPRPRRPRRRPAVADARGVTRRARPHRRRARRRPGAGARRVTALMGRNGSGKSSLLWALQGTGRAARRHGAGRRRRPGRGSAAARAGARWSGCCPQKAADLLYLETVDEECRGRRRRGTRGAARPAGARASPATATPATCPRASGWRSRWRSCWPPSPAVRAPRRAHPRPRLRRQARAGRACCATWPPTAAPCWWPPTTWSSSPRSPTTWSCWPTARSSPPARYAGWSPSRPPFAPQVTKILGRAVAARRRGRRGAGGRP